jgi:hypothetical protein
LTWISTCRKNNLPHREKTSGAAEYSPPQNSILKPPHFCIFTPPVSVLAVSRLLWPQDQTRRSISRVFRMVTLTLGILFSFFE